MKKIYLSLLATAALAPAAMTAQEATAPVAQWGNLLIGEKNNIGIDMTCANDGNLFYLNLIGSTDATQVINLNNGSSNTAVATGSDYSGTASNNGLSLIKTDANGNLLWNAWSTSGEMASNQGGVIATADGGATVVVKVRHTQNYATTPITLTNNSGQTYTYDWTLAEATSSRYYKGLVLHYNAQGNLEWTRAIEVSTAPQANAGEKYAELTSDGIDINAVTSDSDGNIYIVGRFRNPVTFATATDGITITPRNTANWDGNTQTSIGDLYIAKLNADGLAEKVITSAGDVVANESLSAITMQDDKLYIQGTILGTADGSTVTLGGKELNADKIAGMLVARLDKDLNVDWARTIASTYTGTVYQKTQVNVYGNSMYVSGKFRANFVDGDNSLDMSKLTRDGGIIELDATNGAWKNAVAKGGENQSGFYGVFVSNDDPDNIYVYGNTLSKPLFVQKRNKATLELVESWNLYNTTDDVFPACVNNDMLYTNARISGNVTLPGSELTFSATTKTRGELMAAFKMPVNFTSQAAVSGDVNGDGNIDVTDVNAVINIMLYGSFDASADINGDGVVDVSDINAIINQMMKK